MLGSLRKFSSSIYAKILLGIVVIPFVFWGMGSTFKGGSKNIVVVIEKEKYTVEEFGNFIQKFSEPGKKITPEQVENFLSEFIADKLVEKEIQHFGIRLSDDSLAKLIKHQKDFKRENKFSRIEYEKFLLKNNITAAYFESNLYKIETKKQLLNFIGGGIFPPKFLVNSTYDKINQKRNIELINLNDVFKKKMSFSDNQIKSYFENNKNKYIETYRSIILLELNPKRLTGGDEFNNLFFERIDEIDDLIIQGRNFDHIMQKYNLEKANTFTLDKSGKEINSKVISDLPKNLIEDILKLADDEPLALMEIEEKYFIVQVVEINNVQKKLNDETVKKNVLSNLRRKAKRKLISEIISKINQNNFGKSDFYNLSNKENVPIKMISLKNQNDDQVLKKELINQIYSFSEKKVIVVHDIEFAENFLIYIDKIENVTINKNSQEYKKYLNLSKLNIANELYNTYDDYIKNRYKIDINYQALNTVKNYFN